jgi:type IV pilus assembly protein PilE
LKETLSSGKHRGFTLVEILIVIAILGILYSVALPVYTEQMQRSRRADIQQELLQYSASLERIYSRNGGYPNAFTAQNTDFYTFTYTPTDKVAGAISDFKNRGYSLKASPKSGSAQASDRCGDLTVKHDGSYTASENDCWE